MRPGLVWGICKLGSTAGISPDHVPRACAQCAGGWPISRSFAGDLTLLPLRPRELRTAVRAPRLTARERARLDSGPCAMSADLTRSPGNPGTVASVRTFWELRPAAATVPGALAELYRPEGAGWAGTLLGG